MADAVLDGLAGNVIVATLSLAVLAVASGGRK